MTLCLVRGLLRPGRSLQSLQRRPATHVVCAVIARQVAARRAFHPDGPIVKPNEYVPRAKPNEYVPRAVDLDQFKTYFDLPPRSPPGDFSVGNVVTIHGCISKRRDVSSQLSFVDLVEDDGTTYQFKSSWDTQDSAQHVLHKALKAVPKASAVSLSGLIDVVHERGASQNSPDQPSKAKRLSGDAESFELTLKSVHLLNPFPTNIVISKGALYPPPLRHLQLKFDPVLRDRLRFRQDLTETARAFLATKRFSEVETPILFKSTPEGAREFLVPTRRKGYAYALPQSPQQYKQILMAGGTRQYYQFARCFRDEDLRADRQPEFTQLDLEMSFSKGEDVMNLVESLVWDLYSHIKEKYCIRELDGQRYPSTKGVHDADVQHYPDIQTATHEGGQRSIPRITYQEAMALYGSDKPDLRIPNKLQRIEHILPESFISMITVLKKPIVEACVFRFDSPPHHFVKPTWDALPLPILKNTDGQPVPIVIDSSKPLSGLSPLGHEAAERLLAARDDGGDLPNLGSLQEGDLLVIQARPNEPFQGQGSTALGFFRNHIYRRAVEEGLLPFDPSFHFLWVTGFPLFTPTPADADADPGQGGTAGFSSTHHPFTAPLTPADLDLLATSPLSARADHYDLVVNGVELGGGSRRIHVAAVQEYVLREVLAMPDAGVAHFAHLLEALRAGCPPHAGFAFGWDRLVATLAGTDSVRDVIAFPKTKKGEEPVGRSPGKVGDEEWGEYHLRYVKKGELGEGLPEQAGRRKHEF